MTTLDSSPQELLEVLTTVLGKAGNSTIALHEPNIGSHEHAIVAECLSSGWVEYRSRPMYKDGELVGSVVAFNDITQRKQTEEELHQLPTTTV